MCKIISISLNKSARNVKQNNDNKKKSSLPTFRQTCKLISASRNKIDYNAKQIK